MTLRSEAHPASPGVPLGGSHGWYRGLINSDTIGENWESKMLSL